MTTTASDKSRKRYPHVAAVLVVVAAATASCGIADILDPFFAFAIAAMALIAAFNAFFGTNGAAQGASGDNWHRSVTANWRENDPYLAGSSAYSARQHRESAGPYR